MAEKYQFVIAAVAMVIVLYFAMRLARSIRKDREKEQNRKPNLRRGPALLKHEYKSREGKFM